MRKYVAALFCDLCEHSQAWNCIPKEQMDGLVGEYWALARKVADRHGSFHSNFTGDGHLFLFDNADAAVRFGLKLIGSWRDGFGTTPALQGLEPILLRVGAHFGEVTEIGNGEAWVGRANNVAKRIQDKAEPDTVFVSESILDLIDFPRYRIQRVAHCKLKGDCVARRTLYHVVQFDEAASAAKPPDELTAEDWFLRGVAMIGTEKEGSDEEEACYVQALRLGPDLAAAHNNYAILLKEKDDVEGAEGHYKEALRLRPRYAAVHYNYALLLKEKGDVEGVEGHYKEAEGHYKEALRLRPDLAGAHYNYAILLRQQGHPRNAKRHFEQAFRLAPDNPDIKTAYERRAWRK